MKRVLTLLLVLAICFSLCACGKRDVTSPGAAGEETVDENKSTESDANSGDEAETENNDNSNTDADADKTNSQKSDGSGSFDVGSLDINVSYGNDMTHTSIPEEKTVVIEHGMNNKLYIQDVTGVYNPDTTDPSSFLYDYAYESCVELVNNTFGQVLDFSGEEALPTSGNELYGYGAFMTCAHNTDVYAFIKLIAIDNGYAVIIGICEKAEMNIFDNVVIS